MIGDDGLRLGVIFDVPGIIGATRREGGQGERDPGDNRSLDVEVESVNEVAGEIEAVDPGADSTGVPHSIVSVDRLIDLF